MLASGLAIVSWLDAGSAGIPSVTAFTGVPTAMLLKAASPPRSSTAPLPGSGCIGPRFASPGLTTSASMFHGSGCQHHQQQEERSDDDGHHCRTRRSRSTVLYCNQRDYPTQRPNISWRSDSPGSTPLAWCISANSSSREGNSLGGGGGGGGYCSHRRSSGDVGVHGAAVRRQTSRLMAAGRDGEGETPHPHDEDEQQESTRPRSREEAFYGSSIHASKRGPPEEDDIWSKHSVFEFKRWGGG